MRKQGRLIGGLVLAFALMSGLSLLLIGCGDDSKWEIKNQPPKIAAIGDKSVTEGQSLSFEVTATDPDGDDLTLWVENPPSNSKFVDEGQGKGTFTFYPNFTQDGIVEAMFMVSDGRASDSALVKITIVDEEFTHHAGIITESETWLKANNPHLVAGDIEIENGAVVTIEPGCMVYFIEGRRIRVGYSGPGGLIADGTEGDLIYFTSVVENPTPGIWDGITFAEHCVWQTSKLSYCEIAYGGGNGDANVFVDEGTVSITNCRISQSAANGIFFAGNGHAENFEGNQITDNRGYPVTVSCNYLGRLTGSNLTGNDWDTLIVRGQLVDTDATWDTLGVPFRFTTAFEIAGGATITIVPGNTLIFDSDVGIEVGKTSAGTLIADGTPEKTIVFTASEAPAFPGAWGGIAFYGFAGPECLLANCTIEYAGGTQSGNIYVNSSEIGLHDAKVIKGSQYGIYLNGSGRFSSFEDNEIYDNGAYPIRISAAYAGQLDGSNTYTPNGIDKIVVYSGELTEEATWPNLGIPYRVTGIVDVDQGGKLTLAAGNTLLFTSAGGVVVGDSGPAELIADGSEDRIAFIPATEGDFWKGIRFMGHALSSSILDSCDISHVGGIGVLANVHLKDCQVIIRHCLIEGGSQDGVTFEGTAYPLQFESNIITANAKFPVTIDCNNIGMLPPGNVYADNGESGFQIRGDTIYTSSTWSDPGVPLIIGSNITLAPFVNLTLSAGLALQFDGRVGLWVGTDAALIADGTDGQIKFTPKIKDNEYGTNWQGLVFLPGASNQSILKNCFVHMGGADRVTEPRPGCVHVDGSQISIIDCYIDSSKYNGVYFGNGGYANEFHGNTITLNSYYPVRVDGRHADFLSMNNDYTGNRSDRDQIQIGGEAVDRTASWPSLDIPYYIADSIEIADGGCLTIDEGNTILINSRGVIAVRNGGCLLANGQPGDSITFTRIGSNWKCLRFEGQGAVQSALDHCIIDYGGNFPVGPKGAVWTVNSAPSITNCRISNSLSCGIYVEGSPRPDPTQLSTENTFYANKNSCNVGP